MMDIITVKDEIKRNKNRFMDIDRENKRLQSELEDLQKRNGCMKTEFNILSCMEEIRLHDDILETTEYAEPDKKFREAYMKLEIQVLNDEIRQVIPKLESEISQYDIETNKYNTILRDQQAELALFPKQFLIDAEELLDKIEIAKQRKLKLESSMSKSENGSKQDISSIRSNNEKLKVQIATISEETIHIIGEAQSLKHELIQENARIDFLSNKIKSLRRELTHYNDGKGWQTEAFLVNTGSRNGTLDTVLIPELLRFWISPGVDISNTRINQLTGNKASLNITEFIKLCDELLL
jgi:hypothetical protein